MNFKPFLKKQLRFTVVILMGLLLSSSWIIYHIYTIKTNIQHSILSENTKASTEKATSSAGLPSRLKIPAIGVDARIEEVGLTSSGAMDTPDGPVDVGWYSLGTRPGEVGSSVIAGHFGWKNQTPAVFDNLHKLQKGDKIYVENKQEATETFVVREIRLYDKDADATNVFFSHDGVAHLNLITCTGPWNTSENTRATRLIVFTDKV